MVKFGYHLDTSSISFDKAIASMKASGADYHLIMIDNGGFFLRDGDIATIRRYLDALPECKLIVRLYNRLEGNYSQYPLATQYEAEWRKLRTVLGDTLTSRIVFDAPSNEPNLVGDSPTEAKKFVDYCIALAHAASNAGVKIAVGGFSVGTPHESLIKTIYAPLWRVLSETNQGISLHAYGAAIPELGEFVDLTTVLDPVKSRAAITRGKWPMDYAGWLIARPYRIIQAYAELGLGVPNIYVTEGIIDNIFNSQNSAIKDAWRQHWGIDAFNRDPRGVQSWERWLLEVFKADGFDFQQSLQFLYHHARKNIFYHEAFKAVCIYALNAQWGYGYAGHNTGTNAQAGSNYDHPAFDKFRMEYLPAINADNLEALPPVTPPISSFVLFNAKVHSLKTSNVRALPHTSAAINGLITPAYLVCQISKEAISNDGYEWLKLSSEIVSGYVAKTENLVIEYIETPIPTPEKRFVIDFGMVELSGSEKAKLANTLEQFLKAVNEAPEK